MAPETIQVNNLSKTYQVSEREGGFGAAVRSFFKRKYKDVKAVQEVNFKITQGEIVGFLGPNGAGKTTTLKMLSGLLHPTGGNANVLGFTPWELIPDDEYQKTYKELDELLELEPIMKKPVRNLSLGERMKCEIAAGLLHRPKVLFLDEPTIGLDITGQARIREFLREYNRRTGATILLTSHYMADVTALCERIIIIHHGNLKYDGGIGDLSRKIAPFKLIGIRLAESNSHDLSHYGTPVQNEEDWEKQYIQVKAEDVTRVTSGLLANLPIHDITITDPPIEDVIEQAFNQ